MMLKKKIVVSGINMTEGGIQSILKDVLVYMDHELSSEEYEITALVNNKSIFNFNNINIIEFPKAKKNWIYRIYYEYFYFYWFSRKKNIYYWLSMHDITPNVVAKHIITYCHNAAMFYNIKSHEIHWDYKFALFCKFYKYLYKINITKNTFVIVQQEWIRKKFNVEFNIDNIIVAYPQSKESQILKNTFNQELKSSNLTFFYPSLPRVHKNHITLFEAVKLINKKGFNIEVVVTLDGTENKYSKNLFKKYKNVSNIRFVGIINREDVYKYYEHCDVMVFPSQLETWGLPLSEFRIYNKPIIVSDLPYAHEALNGYDKILFFDSASVLDLVSKIEKLISTDKKYMQTKMEKPNFPFARNWNELFSIILN